MDIFNQIFNVDCYKDYAAVRGIQNIYTPIDKIEEATGFEFNSVINSSTKEVGVLFNFEFIENLLKKVNKDYINNIHITFFYDSKFDLNETKFICACNNFSNISFESIEDFSNSKNIKDLEKIMANKKFDVIFSNPPYGTANSNALDLIILKSCFSIANKIIFIHPSEWFLNKYPKKQIKTELKNSSKLEKISLIWGNSIFDIGIFMPLCISEWNTCKKTNFVKINDIAFSNKSFECNSADFDIHYGNVKDFYKDYVNFISKLKNYDSIYLHRVKADLSDLTDYSIKIANIRGHIATNGFSPDFFTYIGLNEKKINYTNKTYTVKRNRDDERKCWSFNNENSRKNFVSYMKTKFVRFGNSLAKVGQCPTYEFIPWLDFTQEWNDANLCKEFGISEELWNYIDNFIPDYYEDYKSGF